MVKQLLLVGIGGGAGSIFRYLASILAGRQAGGFPWATFLVNISGCLLIGLFAGLAARCDVIGADFKMLFVTGFCGGYTTFSTFSAENLKLLNGGNWGVAAIYIVASLVVGLLAVCVGNWLSKIEI
ncbi:MAG: fluoride efflux transporter CrcB [Prevotellaceae bacterium]|jgi:CrcB protein|nr:fluoride efflux transporter CrcB [Prevotellaceae bacterium]